MPRPSTSPRTFNSPAAVAYASATNSALPPQSDLAVLVLEQLLKRMFQSNPSVAGAPAPEQRFTYGYPHGHAFDRIAGLGRLGSGGVVT
jgi:hypothetical protein